MDHVLVVNGQWLSDHLPGDSFIGRPIFGALFVQVAAEVLWAHSSFRAALLQVVLVKPKDGTTPG